MKRKELEKRIRKMAKAHRVMAAPVRQGKHEIWECEGFTFPIPRHNEIAEGTAKVILRQLQRHLEDAAE